MMKKLVLFISFILLIYNLFSQSLTTETSDLFSGSGNCSVCHAAAEGVLMTSGNEDMSPVTLWRSTMMGNSNKDPLWQAKVTAEVEAHPELKTVIEDKCNTCHSPMGRTEAINQGEPSYSFDGAMTSEMSRDGVSCTVCHQVQSGNLGSENSFSGGYEITDVHKIFGPYENPMAMPMFNQSGYTPEYSNHVKNSELCATCHTLFTPFVNNSGEIGGYLPEQVPYLEWKNSIYPEQSIECQTCHMPAVNESMKIATRPPMLDTKRTPVWKHDFVGGNTFMNKILKTNTAGIGVSASSEELDNTRLKTEELLKGQTLDLKAEASFNDDTLVANVLLENLCGHKIPSGFPSRRIWLHLKVTDLLGNTIFESGNWDDEGKISGVDEGFEPHHTVIKDEAQVQIYEAVMNDVDDQVTYTLLRGAKYGKDNRIPPKGFVSSVAGYGSISIEGDAKNDNNFNKVPSGDEGSGSDMVTYKVKIPENVENVSVEVNVCYQTITPRFASDLFRYNTEKVNTFKSYYEAADKLPVVMKSAIVTNISTSLKMVEDNLDKLRILPNPFQNSTTIHYKVARHGDVRLRILNMEGKEIETIVDAQKMAGNYQVRYSPKGLVPGIYLCNLMLGQESISKKLLFISGF